MKRIVFNGQEYAGREAMPEDVRNAYDEALALLRAAHPEVDPSTLDASGDTTVISVRRETSIEFEGSGAQAVPAVVRRMLESPGPPAPDPLHTPMGMLLAFVAGFVLVLGVALMFAIGGGREHLPGRLAVAVTALLFLGWLDTMAIRLARRRESLLGPDTPGYRRFVVWSAAGLACAAVLLLGVAWYLP